MSETNVSVTSRGVEIGRRLHLSEIGPTGAYLQHDVPMPVGSELQVTTDDGTVLGVVVVRVQEQVAGAVRSPGMHVRVVELSSDAEAWWKEHLSTSRDPVFPEPALDLAKATRPTVRLTAAEISAVTAAAPPEPEPAQVTEPAPGLEPVPAPEPVAESAPEVEPVVEDAAPGSNGAGATIPGISAAAAIAAAQAHEAENRTVRDVNTTVKMTPEQVRAAASCGRSASAPTART